MKANYKTPPLFPLFLFALGLTLALPARAQVWATNQSLLVARWAHTATLLTNGTVLIAGGEIYNMNGDLEDTNECEIYDPSMGAPTVTGSMQSTRHGHRATLLSNGQVLVTGGGGDSSSEVYDPGSGTWIDYENMNYERDFGVAVLLPNGKVLAAGGYDEDTGLDLTNAEIYDPVAQTWTPTGSMPYPADTFTAILLTNDTVLVCGGSDASDGIYTETNAAIYYPATGTWTNTTPMNEARSGHTATLLPDGNVLVTEGVGDGSAEIYNPSTATWTLTRFLGDGRNYPITALLSNGTVLALGGDPYINTGEIYDEAQNQWFYTAQEPVSGMDQAITMLADGRVLVTGGSQSYYNGPALATVETFTANLQSGHILIAHYPFDTSTTNVTDAQFLEDTSGNAFNLNAPYDLGDGVAAAVTTNNVAGGTAVQFDGTGYFELPSAMLTTISGSYSISLWLKTTQVSGSDNDPGFDDPAFVWAGGVASPYYDSEPMTLTGHKLGFYTGGENETLHSVSNIDSGNFTHIVITRDQPSGVKKIYINGNLDAKATNGTYFLPDSPELDLGVSQYAGGVAGIIDDVQIYNGVLNATEVANLFATPGTTAPDTAGIQIPTLTVTDAPLSGSAPLSVQFNSPGVDSDGNTVTNWNWSFGDGTTSSAQNPQHTYTSAGSYTPTLVAYSPFGAIPLSVDGLDAITVTNPTPSIGSWTMTGSLAESGILTNGIIFHTATLLNNGEVLVAGGENIGGNVYTNTELYNPVSGTWSPSGSLKVARYSHTATLLTNGMVLVAGGATDTYDNTSATASAELYNPTNGQWTLTGSMHTARYAHTATLLPDGTVLVAGGEGTNEYPNPNITDTAEIYNPATGLWTPTNSMNTPRYAFTATLLTNGEVLVASGESTNNFLLTPLSELYDPSTGTWTASGILFEPAANYASALLPDGTVLEAGGDIDSGSFGGVSLFPDYLAQLYNPTSGSWSSLNNMYSTRDYCTATLLNDGTVLVVGSQGYGSAPTNSAELYLPTSQTWMRAAAMNVPRNLQTATLLTNGLVLVVGGRNDLADDIDSAELYSTVIARPPIILNNLLRTTGSFSFSFHDTAGSTNNVFFTTNVATAFSNWTFLGVATEVSAGNFQFTDTNATNKLQFYRVYSP